MFVFVAINFRSITQRGRGGGEKMGQSVFWKILNCVAWRIICIFKEKFWRPALQDPLGTCMIITCYLYGMLLKPLKGYGSFRIEEAIRFDCKWGNSLSSHSRTHWPLRKHVFVQKCDHYYGWRLCNKWTLFPDICMVTLTVKHFSRTCFFCG